MICAQSQSLAGAKVVQADSNDIIAAMNSRRIEGYEEYEITDSGDVYRVAHPSGTVRKRYKNLPRKLKPGIRSGTGYLAVVLHCNGKPKSFYVHELVARTFIGSRPKAAGRIEIAHLDGDKTNNTVSNLAYVPCSENNKHKIAHGTHAFGERLSPLTTEQISRLKSFNGTHADAARAFGIKYATAYSIRRGVNWKYATVASDISPTVDREHQ